MLPVLQEQEVDDLERELIDDDFTIPRDQQEQARVESARRRLADRALLTELAATEFAGPAFHLAVTEFAAYGIVVLMAWMRTGEIIAQCKARGRPLAHAGLASRWSRDDRLEIAVETTARALRFFIEEVLKKDRWDHRRGASLRTFFVGACLLQFPNVFDVWAREQKVWGQVHDRGSSLEDAADPLGRDTPWADSTGEAAIRKCLTEESLARISDPRTRHVARMVMRGHSFAAAGEEVGLSAAAVEGRLYRLRRRHVED